MNRCAPLSIAPMMDRTDRHFRYLVRQISRKVLLYSEMVNMNALMYGEPERHLGYHPAEHPLALQLGGDDPATLARCAQQAERWGYDEVNLNVGCPSERVQSGNFGACLMADPKRVAAIVQAMRTAVNIPVTVKHRIGIDQHDSYADMSRFVEIVAGSGVRRFTVHARKAWLQGLSPRENREIPPLRYGDVYRLKAEYPELEIEINGGVRTVEAAGRHLEHVDAVMIGRAAYDDPYLLAHADALLAGEEQSAPSRGDVILAMLDYTEERMVEGTRLPAITRHLLNLFVAQPGAKAWRRYLSENAHLPGAGPEVIAEALTSVPAEVAAARVEPGQLAQHPVFEVETPSRLLPS